MPVSVNQNQVITPQATQSKVSFAVQSSNSPNVSKEVPNSVSNPSLESTVNNNNSSLTTQADQAKQSGVNVQVSAPKQVSSVSDANADYNQNKTALNNAMQQQNTYNQQYQNAQKQYNTDQTAIKQANQTLSDTINAAKQAGIKVTVGSNQNVNSVSNMQKDYSGQEQALQNLINSYKKEAAQAQAKNQQITVANQKAQQQYQSDEATYNKNIVKYQNDMQQYQKSQQQYNQAVQGLSKDGIALSGVDPSSITQKLILKKAPNATVKVLSSSSGVKVTIQNPYNDKNAPAGVDSKELIMVDANNGFKGINGNVITVEYDGDLGSYNGDEITKEVRTYKNLLPFVNPNASKLYMSSTETFDKARLNIYSDPTDGFWYNGSAGIETSTQFYDANGKLINFDPKLAYLTIQSLNHHANLVNKSEDGSIESAQLLSSGKADQIKGSSVTVHNGNYLYSDKVNDQNSKVWDVTGSLQEYYGAGLFQVGGTSIDIKWSCADPKEGYSPIVWAQDSTTIPFIPTVVAPPQEPKKPVAPSLQKLVSTPQPGSFTAHYDNFEEKSPSLSHASVTYNLDNAESGSSTIKYVNSKTGQEMPNLPEKTTSGVSGSSYKWDEPQVPGYTVSKVEGNLTGTYVGGKTTQTIIYYTPVVSKGSADVKYINSVTGQEMPNLPLKTSEGNVGDTYKWDEPQVPGYTISKVEGNLTGKYIKGQPSHTVVYYTPIQQKESANVKYINSVTGQEMPNLPAKTSEGNVGDTYKWDEPQVPGYTISKVEGNLTGKYIKGQPSHTVVYYTPIQQKESANVKYINSVTGQEMPNLPAKTSEGNVGDTYKWDEPQVPGYTISKVEGSLTGKYVKGQPSHTVVYYTPIKKSVNSKSDAKPMIQYQTQSQNAYIPSSVASSVAEKIAPKKSTKVALKPTVQETVSSNNNVISSEPAKKSAVSTIEKTVAKSNKLPETGMSNDNVEFAAAMLALVGLASLKKHDKE